MSDEIYKAVADLKKVKDEGFGAIPTNFDEVFGPMLQSLDTETFNAIKKARHEHNQGNHSQKRSSGIIRLEEFNWWCLLVGAESR